jgi:hypothetical protein
MKTMILSKRALLAICLSTALFVASCDDDDDELFDDITHDLSGQSSGSQEVPPVTTSGSGNLTGNYDRDDNSLTYTVTWTGLSGIATAAHFHGPAGAGVNAGVLLPLSITANAAMNGTASGTVTVSQEFEDALLAGNIYYNVHTALNPDGEIRGQVIATED